MLRSGHGPIDEEDAPPWGELPIDIYLVENWDEALHSSAEEQYGQLIQQYFALGAKGRAVYGNERKLNPSQEQISNILKPFRPLRLRAAAAALLAGVCLRLDYSDDQQSADFWSEELEGTVVDYDGVIIDDKESFGEYHGECEAEGDRSAGFARALRLMPEIIAQSGHDSSPNNLAQDHMEEWGEAPTEDREEIEVAIRNYLAAGTIMAEDTRTHTEEQDEEGNRLVLQALYDEYGNLISSLRVPASEALIMNDWAAVPREAYAITYSENFGVEYRPGGKFAPPYDEALKV